MVTKMITLTFVIFFTESLYCYLNCFLFVLSYVTLSWLNLATIKYRKFCFYRSIIFKEKILTCYSTDSCNKYYYLKNFINSYFYCLWYTYKIEFAPSFVLQNCFFSSYVFSNIKKIAAFNLILKWLLIKAITVELHKHEYIYKFIKCRQNLKNFIFAWNKLCLIFVQLYTSYFTDCINFLIYTYR